MNHRYAPAACIEKIDVTQGFELFSWIQMLDLVFDINSVSRQDPAKRNEIGSQHGCDALVGRKSDVLTVQKSFR